MAGHSKWANTKHRKAAQDVRRGKLWSKLIREVTVAARMGGGSTTDNTRLRAAVDTALGANMPKDTIERAVQRGAGGQDGADVEELTYEGYAPGGVAVLVEVMTDNRNRAVAEIRHAFSKHGGNLGTDGSVAYLFEKKGVIAFAPGADEESIFDVVLDVGAEDVDSDEDGGVAVTAPPESFGAVVDALRDAALPPDHAEVTMVPANVCPCDEDGAAKVLRLIDALEDLERGVSGGRLRRRRMTPARVLGIDPGSRTTGYGLIDRDGNRMSYVASGCIRTEGSDFHARLAQIYHGIETVIDDYGPAEVAVEEVFVARNPSSALKLGQARGAAIAAAIAHDMPVTGYAARRVKQAVVGTGRATKQQVQHMVKATLALSEAPAQDAADALAVALCHAQSSRRGSARG